MRTATLIGVLAGVATPLRAQAPRDTLHYSVAIITRDPHLMVEARLSVATPGVVILAAPPAAGSAGTAVAGLAATDDRGINLEVRRGPSTWTIAVPSAGAVRFRYRLDVHRRVAEGSTSSGLDSTRFYAVTRSLFVAPDPTALRKSGRPYPLLSVHVYPPESWRVFSGWQGAGVDFVPADGDDLLGGTLAAGADFRVYDGSVGATGWQLAIRGNRYFSDSVLVAAIRASLGLAANALGPVPVSRVTFTGDVGRKGRTSGSLQGVSSIGLVWEPSEILETARLHDLFHETLHLWFGGALETERWWVEGVTDYLAARLYSEWQSRPDDLALLCFQSLRNYQGIEHHARITMTEENRRRMGGDNTELLVYRKGMLAGLLLDAAIRRGSNGRKSIDDVSRQLLQLSGQRRSRVVREAEVRDALAGAGGEQALAVWRRVVEGTDPISEDDVAMALQAVTGRSFPVPPFAKSRKELSR